MMPHFQVGIAQVDFTPRAGLPLLGNLREDYASLGAHDPLMAIRVGSLGIVGLPGEVFTEFGRQIKAESPAEHALVIELANDAIGYLPTPEAFNQGGYEVTPGATLYERDAGQRLANAALEQLNTLFDG